MIHGEFTYKIKKLQQDYQSGTTSVSVELMEFLQKWLVSHIQGTDRAYVPILKPLAQKAV